MAKHCRSRSTRFKGLAFAAGLSWIAAPGGFGAEPAGSVSTHATVMPARFPIQVEQVVTAANKGLSLEGAAVSLVTQITASTEEPSLAVTGLEPWGERRARIRISCLKHDECLSFYAVAEWPDAAAAKVALAGAQIRPKAEHAAGSVAQFTAQTKTRADALPALPRAKSQAVTTDAPRVQASTTQAHVDPTAPTEIVAKSGSHATLLLDGERLHIKVPVICLESGAVGRTIRVAAADHRQTYSAEVVDATLLKGTL